MGAVSLVQNHHGVPHMSMNKVNPEVFIDHFPDLSPLNQAYQKPGRFGEVHMVCSGFWWGEGGLQGDYASDAMLHLLMCHHKPSRQVFYEVRSPDALSLNILLSLPPTYHLSPVRRVGVPDDDVEWISYHYHYLIHIFTQSQPVKHPCENIKRSMEIF